MGKIVTVMMYCVLGVSKGQRNELCFKTAYRNCECKCVDGTSSEGDCVLELFQKVEQRKVLFSFSFHFQQKV